MQITPRDRLLHYADLLQGTLFGALEAALGQLSERARLVIAIVEMIGLHRQLPCARGWVGRPAKDRHALASAFIAKSVYGLETTRRLLERLHTDRQLRWLCGWPSARQIPHESTFSRAFQEFAESELPQRLHEALVLKTQKDRLVGHIARDSTAIEARERFEDSPKHKSIPKRKRGRPRPGERALSGRRLPRQRRQTIEEMLEELPRHCDLGVKKSSKGHQQYWRGYKLHLDVADGQIPISCLLTAASLHDSQAAIPLATLTAQRVTSLYDLMDCAYDANEIYAHSESLGHVPLIARHDHRAVPIPKRVQDSLRRYDKRRSVATRYDRKRPPFTPAEEQRFHERTMVERVYSRLKDEFGGRFIRVRGASKIMAHLMFGVLALTVDQLLKLTG
jgi:transposase